MFTMLTREREGESEREREGRKLVIFLTSCLCKSGQNLSRKGYPPFGVGDRNNTPPWTEIIKNIVSPAQHPLQQQLHPHHRHLHHPFDAVDTTCVLHLYYGYFIETDTIICSLVLMLVYFFLIFVFFFVWCTMNIFCLKTNENLRKYRESQQARKYHS